MPMREKSKARIVKTNIDSSEYQKVLKAMNLMYETFEINDISNADALNAAWNVIVSTLKCSYDLPHETFEALMHEWISASKCMWEDDAET